MVATLAQRDPVMFELMVKLLHEQDQAKSILQRKGYGCTGMPWIELVNEVPGEAF